MNKLSIIQYVKKNMTEDKGFGGTLEERIDALIHNLGHLNTSSFRVYTITPDGGVDFIFHTEEKWGQLINKAAKEVAEQQLARAIDRAMSDLIGTPFNQ